MLKAKATRKPPELWYTHHDGEQHRVVAIEYQEGYPQSVMTEEHWDNSGKSWFNPAMHQATGTTPSHWDFDRCRRDKATYYHLSGSGGILRYCVCRFTNPVPPQADLWVAPGVPIVASVRTKDGTWTERRIGDGELLRRGYRRIAWPKRLPLVNVWPYRKAKSTLNPFEAAWEGDTVYCDRCQDDLPTEDSYEPCEHIRWCDECATWFYTDDHTFVQDTGTHDCPDEEAS